CYDPLTFSFWPFNEAQVKRLLATNGGANLSRVKPGLTENWELAADRKTYTFHLRQGVKSSFGNELTAQDVLWSFRKTYAFNTNRKYSLYMQGGLDSPHNIRVVDKYTLVFRLPAPNEVFPLAVGFFSAGIQDSTEVKKHTSAKDP